VVIYPKLAKSVKLRCWAATVIVGSPNIIIYLEPGMNKKTLSVILTSLVIISGVYLFQRNRVENNALEELTYEQNQAINPENISITQSIVFGQDNTKEFSMNVSKDTPVLFALLDTGSLEIEVKEYSFGSMVESIDGYQNGTDEKYWVYTVNEQKAEVGAGEYILSDGDSVVWEFKAYEE
jgi:hypothetical protein